METALKDSLDKAYRRAQAHIVGTMELNIKDSLLQDSEMAKEH